MKSFITHLECTYCGDIYSAHKVNRICISCSKVLFARYDLPKAALSLTKNELKYRTSSMWRYFEVMPVLDENNIVTLGEGFTPILHCKNLSGFVGANRLYMKDEGLNPTASFKARGLSAAVSKAKELGISSLTMPSAGNAAGAMSAYAAKARIDAHVFMPQDAPTANKEETLVTGGDLNLIDGLINDAGILSNIKAVENGWFDVSTLKEPYRVEGKKTMGYEIAEQMNWDLPDVIIYPTGGGTGIVGMWKAFDEMEKMGWIPSKRPKMYAVQAEGCAPIVRAFEQDAQFAEPWEHATTYASGMRVPVAIGDYLILDALRESDGGALTVTDNEMKQMTPEIASREGDFVCPEGAATVVALEKLIKASKIHSDDKVLLLNTGSGLKYIDLE